MQTDRPTQSIPTDLRRTREQVSALIDAHLDWFARWTRALFFPADLKVDPPRGLHEFVETHTRQTVVGQPAMLRLVNSYDDLHARAMALVLRAAIGQSPTSAEYGSALDRFSDLMGQLRRIERAFVLALYGVDSLTGLRAREGMRDDLLARIARRDRGDPGFCLALADIDRLRRVNALHGRPSGDRAIIATADLLTAHLGPQDVAYRASDDTFLLCLHGCALDEATQRVEKLRRAVLATPVALPTGHVVRMTMSFGLIEAVADLTADELIYGAESALRQAKSSGRNRVVRARPADIEAELEGESSAVDGDVAAVVADVAVADAAMSDAAMSDATGADAAMSDVPAEATQAAADARPDAALAAAAAVPDQHPQA